ncbi:MAG: Hsp20/alpha crystallin family protein [Verrucomicrobiaceae bacterium]|nr:MAG: Hsp20/alpha crystallin family protein [Verrucomicrobiaceae bacterium]
MTVARFVRYKGRYKHLPMNFIHRNQPNASFFSQFDRLFDRSLAHASAHASAPREAFHESDSAWILRIDVPGYAKEDIRLTLDNDILTLVGETPADRPFGGKFERKWKLGSNIDGPATSARLENGVLELTIPKKPKVVVEPTQIEIR